MKYRIPESISAKKLVDSLSFKDLLNQVCCPMLYDIGEEKMDNFGAMFFHPWEGKDVEQLMRRYKEKCTIPPLIAGDLECGAGGVVSDGTKFPSLMGLSQTNSPELAYDTGRITAEEASRAGFNWTFSPVADVLVEPDCPIVSMRSAGCDPDHVIKIVTPFMLGLQEHGLMATIKHFPGDGFGIYDQHVTTPQNPLDMNTWRKSSGKVFKSLIDSGAMAVMPGHISLPSYDDKDDVLGLCPPATLSKKLLKNLLRGELGFEGLIVTDAMGMGGVVGFMNCYDAYATALENGCDVLLFVRIDENFYKEMEDRLKSGMLTMQTLKERATRIVSLKEQLGLFKKPDLKETLIDKTANRKKADIIVEKSVSLIRDRKALIPFAITKETRVLHLVVMNDHTTFTDVLDGMKKEIEKYSNHVTRMIDPGPDALFKVIYERQFDLVICSIGCNQSYGINVVRLHEKVARNMMQGWMRLGTPVIFVSHFHPFIHKEYEASIDTIINTYGNADHTAEHVLKGITGSVLLTKEILVQR